MSREMIAALPKTPPQLLWEASGRPQDTGRGAVQRLDRLVVCHICATLTQEAVSVDEAISSSDNDRAVFKAVHSPYVCPGCAWTSARKPPDTFRMYSVLYREAGGLPPHCEAWSKAVDAGKAPHLSRVPQGHYLLTNKSRMLPILHTLTLPQEGRWFACLADSGQLHTLRQSVLNAGGPGTWQVRLERMDVRATPARFAQVIGIMAQLMARGHLRMHLERGEPTVTVLLRDPDEEAFWQEAYEVIGADWTGPLCSLALFLITKETQDDAARCYRSPRQASADPAPEPPDHDHRYPHACDDVRGGRGDRGSQTVLPDDAQGDQGRGRARRDLGRVARRSPHAAQDPALKQGSGQLTLFDG